MSSAYTYKYLGYGRELRRRRPRELNIAFLVRTVVALAVLLPAGFFWHQYQIKRLAAGLLERAERLESSHDFDAAANCLYRYLRIHENDPAAMARLAQDYDKAIGSANPVSVIKWYYRAIGLAPNRMDLRTRLAELLVATGQFAGAQEQSEYVLAQVPNDRIAQKCQALAIHGRYRGGEPVGVEQVRDVLSTANTRWPGDVELADLLADIYRSDLRAQPGSVEAQQADEVMRRLVEAEPNNALGYLARGRYRARYGLAGSGDDIARAYQLGPDQPAVVMAAAEAAGHQADWNLARRLYTELIRLVPTHPFGYLGLGDVEFALGNTARAIETWQNGRKETRDGDISLTLRAAEAMIGTGQLDEAHEALLAAEEQLRRLVSADAEQTRVWAEPGANLLRAKWYLEKQNPWQAIPLLERAAVSAAEIPTSSPLATTLPSQAYTLLGMTCGKLGQWQQAVASFEEAVKLQPLSGPVRVLAAKAWAQIGDLETAVLRCQQAVEQSDAPADAWLLLAKYRLRQQLQVPPQERDWERFERGLTAAQEQLPNSWEVPLLQAEYWHARDGEEARGQILSLLWSQETAHPNDPALWKQLVLAYEALGQSPEVERALSRYERLLSGSPAPRILRADLETLRGNYSGARQLLDAARPDSPASDIRELDLAQLRLDIARGDTFALRATLQRLVRAYPQDFEPRYELARLAAYQNQDQASWKSAVEGLKKVEGPRGTHWKYAEARRLLAEASSPGDPLFAEAVVLQRAIAAARPTWALAGELAGRAAEFRGQPPEAIDAYTAVLPRAVGDPSVWERLIRLLYEQEHYTRAEACVRQLLASPTRTLTLSNSADEWFQQRLRWVEALSQARGAAERDPHDTYAHIWLGVLLSVHAKDAEAAEVLQRGVETAVADPRPWLALVSLFGRTGATDDARRVLERLERQVPLPPWQRHFVLGQGFELTDDQAQAEKQYLQVADNTPYAVEARARVDNIVPRGSGPTQTTTVSADAAQDGAGIADRRLKAVMHLRRGGKNDVVKARSLLEQLTASGHAESEDRVLLAKIYEEEGQFANARQQFRELLEQDPAAQYVAVYVEFLLRRRDFAAAESWLDQLEQAPPMAQSSVWLRTRWLAGQGRHAEATALVDAYAARKLESMNTAAESRGAMTEVADIYLAAGMPAAAEQWLRRLAAQFPDETERLARHLVDNDAVEQAIELCLKTLRENSSPESATLLARVLVFGNPSPETQAAAEVILAAALEEFPRDGSLLFAVGNLRLKQNRIDEAIELLQRTTECSPGHYLAWNNLAVLLAEQRGPDSEALAAIERALHVAGYNMPTLLDTKAVVLLHANQFQDAVALLEKVTASPLGNDARYFFHLAVAYHRVGASQSARQALQEANSLGLPETFLTPQEQVLLRRLSDEYAL